MIAEAKIELVSWILMILILIRLIPKKRFFEAQQIFLFMQALTWILGILVVQFGLVEYPYRLFPKVIQTSFSYEFFFLPAVSAIFYVYFPTNRSVTKKVFYVLTFPTFMTLIEVIAEKYTTLVVYIHWNWYCSWISILLVLVVSYLYTKWVVTRFQSFK